jgi:hypothetical protein
LRIVRIAALVAGALVAAAVGAGAVGAGPAAAAAVSGEYVATLTVGPETFRIHLVDAEDVQAAFKVLRGQSSQFPMGTIDRSGPEYNVGYSWHLDPNTVEFTDFSIEVCDGLPSYVGESSWSVPTYCPWSARVVTMVRLPY